MTSKFINNNIYIVYGNIPIRLVKFERNFTKHEFYFVTHFVSKHNIYFETEGVLVKQCYVVVNTFHFESTKLIRGF
jgi:hypothetical protein